MRRLRAGAALALAGLVLGACGSATPTGPPGSAAPATSPAASGHAPSTAPASVTPSSDGSPTSNVACIGIVAAECQALAGIVITQLAEGRGAPFAIQIQASGCEASPCLASLGPGGGSIIAEFLDGGPPISRTVSGTIAAPVFGELDMGWLGPFEPESEPVTGVGPFDIELGHCGLLWKVDFGGAFWVPFGQVDGASSALINADSGTMRLVDADHAVFTDSAGAEIDLVRFPGARHIWGCR